MTASRYQIHARHAPNRFPLTGPFRIQRGGGCINCGKCIQLCVYGVHFRQSDDVRRMAEPDFDKCLNCFACVQDCTANVLSMDRNPAFVELGDALYTPEKVRSLTAQAESGTIPVFGSGYGGAFAGDGFDGMWTDMSEIVRPTRDGIHGRETISTAVDLGRHPFDVSDLRFDDDGNPITSIPPTIEIKIPVLFNRMPFMPKSPAIVESLVRAAGDLGTLAILDAEHFDEAGEVPGSVVVHLGDRSPSDPDIATIAKRAGVFELEVGDYTLPLMRTLRELNPNAFIFVRIPVGHGFEDVVERMATAGAEVLHIDANPYRNGVEPENFHMPDAIRRAHQRLVDLGVRDTTTLVASGSILLAEHVAKGIILGADAVAVDVPLLVALECTLCKECAIGGTCPRELDRIDAHWGSQRLVNLMGSWRNQLLEVLGAMGIREVCRLRGETGRAIFREELDREVFQQLFGEPADQRGEHVDRAHAAGARAPDAIDHPEGVQP